MENDIDEALSKEQLINVSIDYRSIREVLTEMSSRLDQQNSQIHEIRSDKTVSVLDGKLKKLTEDLKSIRYSGSGGLESDEVDKMISKRFEDYSENLRKDIDDSNRESQKSCEDYADFRCSQIHDTITQEMESKYATIDITNNLQSKTDDLELQISELQAAVQSLQETPAEQQQVQQSTPFSLDEGSLSDIRVQLEGFRIELNNLSNQINADSHSNASLPSLLDESHHFFDGGNINTSIKDFDVTRVERLEQTVSAEKARLTGLNSVVEELRVLIRKVRDEIGEKIEEALTPQTDAPPTFKPPALERNLSVPEVPLVNAFDPQEPLHSELRRETPPSPKRSPTSFATPLPPLSATAPTQENPSANNLSAGEIIQIVRTEVLKDILPQIEELRLSVKECQSLPLDLQKPRHPTPQSFRTPVGSADEPSESFETDQESTREYPNKIDQDDQQQEQQQEQQQQQQQQQKEEEEETVRENDGSDVIQHQNITTIVQDPRYDPLEERVATLEEQMRIILERYSSIGIQTDDMEVYIPEPEEIINDSPLVSATVIEQQPEEVSPSEEQVSTPIERQIDDTPQSEQSPIQNPKGNEEESPQPSERSVTSNHSEHSDKEQSSVRSYSEYFSGRPMTAEEPSGRSVASKEGVSSSQSNRSGKPSFEVPELPNGDRSPTPSRQLSAKNSRHQIPSIHREIIKESYSTPYSAGVTFRRVGSRISLTSQTYEELEAAVNKLRRDLEKTNEEVRMQGDILGNMKPGTPENQGSDSLVPPPYYDDQKDIERRFDIIETAVHQAAPMQVVQKLSENVRSALNTIDSKVESIKGLVPDLVTRKDLTQYLSSLQQSRESSDGATAAGRTNLRCLLCGKPANSVTGMITESDVAKLLGPPQQGGLMKGRDQTVLVYGRDNASMRHSSTTRKSPGLVLPKTTPRSLDDT